MSNGNYELNPEMVITTINIPKAWRTLFKQLREKGFYPSATECMRQLIATSLPKLLDDIETIEKYIFQNNLPDLKKYMIKKGFEVRVAKTTERWRGKNNLGNPYWVQDNIDGEAVYINREDPSMVMVRDKDGKLKEYKIKGEA